MTKKKEKVNTFQSSLTKVIVENGKQMKNMGQECSCTLSEKNTEDVSRTTRKKVKEC